MTSDEPSKPRPIAEHLADLSALILAGSKMQNHVTIPDPIRLRGVPHDQRASMVLGADELAGSGFVAKPEAITSAASLVAAEKAPGMVTIVGHQGSGKSTLAAWIAYRVSKQARTGLWFWTYAGDLVATVTRARNETTDVELYARSAPIVVLDDLGQEAQNEDARTLIARVITHRFSGRLKNLTTIVTTGLSSEQIETRYGGGVMRRICSRRDTTVILCGHTEPVRGSHLRPALPEASNANENASTVAKLASAVGFQGRSAGGRGA